MARVVRTGTTRRTAALAAVIGAALFAAAPVASAATPEEAAAGASAGVYVQAGAESVDSNQLEGAVADAADADLDLTVAVLADTPDAGAFAGSLNDLVGGTVLVFTPEEYAAVSSELSQPDLDKALDQAASRLGSDDIAAGVSAFVAAATPAHTNWLPIILVAIVFVAAVAMGGRMVERRATAARRRASLDRKWAELDARADGLANPVLALEQPVELDGRAEVRDLYRSAASQYGELRDALGGEPTPKDVDEIERGLDELTRRINSIERLLADKRGRGR